MTQDLSGRHLKEPVSTPNFSAKTGLPSTHLLSLFVVIVLVAQSDPLFLNFSSEFAADMQAGAGPRQRVIIKDMPHVVE